MSSEDELFTHSCQHARWQCQSSCRRS